MLYRFPDFLRFFLFQSDLNQYTGDNTHHIVQKAITAYMYLDDIFRDLPDVDIEYRPDRGRVDPEIRH